MVLLHQNIENNEITVKSIDYIELFFYFDLFTVYSFKKLRTKGFRNRIHHNVKSRNAGCLSNDTDPQHWLTFYHAFRFIYK